MRMWMVNPKLMCRQHLLGEHVECHMIQGCLKNGKSLDGYVKKNLIEIHSLRTRHAQLVKEMLERGYNHNSPLIETSMNQLQASPELWDRLDGKIDVNASIKELSIRCTSCQLRILVFTVFKNWILDK